MTDATPLDSIRLGDLPKWEQTEAVMVMLLKGHYDVRRGDETYRFDLRS